MNDRRHSERRITPASSTLAERRHHQRRTGERRTSARVPLDLWVEEERGNELYFRRTGNVGVGGLSFEQTIPHLPGTTVRLRFSLPMQDGARVITTQAEVVGGPHDDGLGMGLRFVALTDDDRTALLAFIAAS